MKKKIIEYFQHVITSNINVIRKLNVVQIESLGLNHEKEKIISFKIIL